MINAVRIIYTVRSGKSTQPKEFKKKTVLERLNGKRKIARAITETNRR